MDIFIIIFLLLGPILDITVFYNLPFNIIVRGIYLLIITYLIFRKKKDIKLLCLLLMFGLIQFVFQKFYLDYSYKDIMSNIFKFLYLPLSILYFKNLKLKKERVLSIILFMYIGIYLFSYITKTGASAYLETDGKTGFRGLFTSINEFSAIIVGLLPIVSNYLKNKKKYLILSILFITSIICSLLIGTKVLIAGIIITLLFLIYQEKEYLYDKRSLIQKTIIIIFMIVMIIGFIYLFTKTRIYKNMMVQSDFFKPKNFGEFFNHVLFNDRLSFLNINFNYFKSTNILNWLLGIGFNNNSVKMVEIDIFDILFRYGLLGLTLFLYMFKKINYKDLKSCDKLALVLLIAISLTSGHVLIYPNVCIYIGLLASKNLVK